MQKDSLSLTFTPRSLQNTYFTAKTFSYFPGKNFLGCPRSFRIAGYVFSVLSVQSSRNPNSPPGSIDGVSGLKKLRGP